MSSRKWPVIAMISPQTRHFSLYLNPLYDHKKLHKIAIFVQGTELGRLRGIEV